VNICLPFAVNDAYSGLDLPAGLHHVDGVTALEFARDRHSFAASDLARIDNQQQLLATMMEKAVSTGTLSNPFRLQQVIDSVTASIQVDQGFNLLRLAGQLRGIRPQDVVFDTVPLASTNYLTPGGESAVLWDGPAASQLWTQIRDDQRPAALPAPAPRHAAKSGKAGAKAPAPSQPPPADGQPGQPAAGGQEKTAAQDACHRRQAARASGGRDLSQTAWSRPRAGSSWTPFPAAAGTRRSRAGRTARSRPSPAPARSAAARSPAPARPARAGAAAPTGWPG
jgi:hypothetical protein